MYDNNGGVGTHAEFNAIQNLLPLPIKKHLKKINILVIKTTHTGKIGISKPCIKCIIDMCILPPKRGYQIKNVFYSDTDGNIHCQTLKQLLNSDDHHITRSYRRKSA